MMHAAAPPPRTGPAVASSQRRPGRGRRGRVPAAVAVVILLALSGVTVDALRAPGADPAPAKLAEWARDHGLGRLVSSAEKLQYQQDPPVVGGTPAGGIPRVGGVERHGP